MFRKDKTKKKIIIISISIGMIILLCVVKKVEVAMNDLVGIILLVFYVPLALFVLWCLFFGLIIHREDLVPRFIRRMFEKQ